MTTELDANPILSEPPTPTQNTTDIPLSQWPDLIRNQSPSSSDTGESTPRDPLDASSQIHHTPRSLEDAAVPRPRLVKACTTGDLIQRVDYQSRRRFLIDNQGHIATPRFSVTFDDYGLDELRAPPILPDRARRKSLEHAWSHKPDLPQKSFGQRIHDDIVVGSWIVRSPDLIAERGTHIGSRRVATRDYWRWPVDCQRQRRLSSARAISCR